AWMERPEPTERLSGVSGIQDIRWDARARSNFRMVHQWRTWGLRMAMVASAALVLWAFFGVYRFLKTRARFSELLKTTCLGVVGGALAVGVWMAAAHFLGSDAATLGPGPA